MGPKTELEDGRCCWLMFCFWSLVALRDEIKGAPKVKKKTTSVHLVEVAENRLFCPWEHWLFFSLQTAFILRAVFLWLTGLHQGNPALLSAGWLLRGCWDLHHICWEFQCWKWEDLLLKFPHKLCVDTRHLDGRQSDVSPPSPQPFIKVSPVITMATSVTREPPVADLGATINFPQDLQLPRTHTRYATAIGGLGVCSDQHVQTGQ